MAASRPGPVFAGLMAVCFASAFVVPPRFTTPLRSQAQGLFAPVSRPTRWVAGAVYRHFHPDRAADDGAGAAGPRPADAVYAENHALRTALAALTVKFDQLSRLNADRGLVGDLRALCQPAAVTGTDASGVREALTVAGVGSAAAGRPVVHGTDLVGRVVAAGVTGAQVRLVTDPGFVFNARLAKYAADASGRLVSVVVGQVHPWVSGVGHGAMAIRGAVTLQQVADLHLAVGDLVVLDDRDWPANVQGLTAGRVTAITTQATAPAFADLRVEPVVDLMRLNEVMVVVRN